MRIVAELLIVKVDGIVPPETRCAMAANGVMNEKLYLDVTTTDWPLVQLVLQVGVGTVRLPVL